MLHWIFLLTCLTIAVSGQSNHNEGSVLYLGYYPNGRSVEVISGITGSSQCFDVCRKRQNLYRHCYGATYDYNTGRCRLHTDKYELCHKRWTRDNSRRGAKIMHLSLLEGCGPAKHPNSVSGQAKNLGGAACNFVAFRAFQNTNSLGGTLQQGITTEFNCLFFCLFNAACWAVDFNTATSQCFVHLVAIVAANQRSFTGVNQYQKFCFGTNPAVNPFATQTTASSTTTGTTTPTTAPTVIPIPTIGDNGECPSPFEMLANTTLGAAGSGTQQAATVNTTELCKQACLNDAKCSAADFNTGTHLCFFHTNYTVPTLMRGTQSCCIHFRKLNCPAMMMRQCWNQTTMIEGALIVGFNASQYIRNAPNAAVQNMISCTGVCFFRYTTNITMAGSPGTPGTPAQSSQLIERGCDTTVPFQTTFNCSLPVTTDTANTVGFTIVQSYTCSDSLCNIFTANEAQNLLLYMPFDQTLEDHGPFMRNGFFWNWTMGGFTFDNFERQKNKSALFDGMEMVCTPFNNIDVNPVSPEITVIAWVKREASTPATMAIVSKGTTNTKANSTELFRLTSTFQAPGHTYTFTINLGGTQYSCASAQFPINTWQFVVARVRVMQNTSTGFIDLFVIPDTAVNTTTALTTPNISCPMTGAGNAVLNVGLPTNQDPLCVGGTYVNENFTPIEGTTNFFVGHLDEVRVFRGALIDIATPINIFPLFSILNNRAP